MTLRLLLLGIGLGIAFSLQAQLNPVTDSIPMRDGKKLAADIYLPSTCTECPVILIQTPYNRLWHRLGLPLGTGSNLPASPYAWVIVDWRGFYGSQAAMVATPQRGEDGYDVIDWITAQPWSNGKVGTWGPSALGKIQYETARENHPAHTCAVPLVAAPQWEYTEYFPGGVYRTEYVEQLDALGYGLSATLLANPVRNLTWQYLENSSFYPFAIHTPMLMIGGWYDHNTSVMLRFFNGLKTFSPVPVRAQHKLLMGPWTHGGSGQASVGTLQQGELQYPAAAGWSDSLARRFFEYYLLGQANGWETSPDVRYFQMGEDTWYSAAQWPSNEVTSHFLCLYNDESLRLGIPPENIGSSAMAYMPADPSPTVGGATLKPSLDQGPYDQAPVVESRGDLLVFTSPVLGAPVVMKGKGIAHLSVSSDRRDTDIAIRLTDVYPDGRSMLLGEGIRRLRFRGGYSATDTALAQPGQIYTLDIDLPPLSHTFLPGHRIRLDISSSNYPRFDRNLNNGGTMYTAGDTLTAINTIHHNQIHSSCLELPLTDFTGSIGEYANGLSRIFPNPVHDRLYLEHTFEADFLVEVIDLSGRQVLVIPAGTPSFIEVSALQPGLYLLKLSNSKKTGIQRFIKY